MTNIPLLRPQIPSLDSLSSLYDESIKSGMYTNFGPCFWRAFNLLGAQFNRACLPVSNGTVAIEIAAIVHFEQGWRVAVPDFTCVATLLAIQRAGMHPVIFPCDEKTWTIDLKILAKYKNEFDAMVVVSPFGYHVDIALYQMFSTDHNKKIVFDFAGAYPMHPLTGDSPVCYSMHATKNLATGEGGFISFASPQEWSRAKKLINFAFNEHKETESIHGVNGKLDDLRCAMLCYHLSNGREAIAARIKRKKNLIDAYQKSLPVVQNQLHRIGFPSVCVVAGLDAQKIEDEGSKNGISFRRYYHPLLSKMSGLSNVPRFGKSSELFETCIGLPSDVDTSEFKTVVKFIKSLV